MRKIDKTNKKFKSIQKLSITLNNVNDELKENKKTINKLEKESIKLKDKIDDLKDELEESKDEISSYLIDEPGYLENILEEYNKYKKAS